MNSTIAFRLTAFCCASCVHDALKSGLPSDAKTFVISS